MKLDKPSLHTIPSSLCTIIPQKSLLLCPRMLQFYRIDSLHPLQHTVKTAVLTSEIKETPCIISRNIVITAL